MHLRSRLLLILVVLIVGLVNVTVMAAPEIGGNLDVSLGFQDESSESLTGDVGLYLNLDHYVERAQVHVGLEGGTSISPSSEASLVLDEAYISYFGSNLDLRVGKQRAAWGTALKINPTYFLNPMDMRDPLGDRIAVVMARVDYYIGDQFSITGVFLPNSVPATETVSLNGFQLTAERPATTLENSEYAVRLSAMGLEGFDLSASYFDGKEDTPFPIFMGGAPVGAYFRDVQSVGFDLATSLGDMGVWAEGSYSRPEAGEDYHQWVIGGDYRFPNGLFISTQYYKTTAQGEAQYLLGVMEKTFSGIHNWRIGALYGLDTQTYVIMPELTLSIGNATSLVLGMDFVEAEGNQLPMARHKNDGVYAKLVMSF